MRASIFVILIIVGLTWAVFWGPLRYFSLLRPPAQSAQAASRAPTGGAQTKAGAEVRKGVGSKKVTVVSEPEVLTVREQPAATVAQAPPVRFPREIEIPIGMQGSRIVEVFGPPVARTTAVDDQTGRVETFIYRRTGPDIATVVQLRNGQVVSATTTAY